MTYRNLKTREIKELPARKGDMECEDEDISQFELKPGEYLINFYIRFMNSGDYIYQIGFETNKKRKILKGTEKGEEKIINCNLQDNIIIGTFGHYSSRLQSIGVQYISTKQYQQKFYIAYFELKFKIKKDKQYKKKIESKYKTLKESDKYLFQSCLLPDGTFFEIIKFCIL